MFQKIADFCRFCRICERVRAKPRIGGRVGGSRCREAVILELLRYFVQNASLSFCYLIQQLNSRSGSFIHKFVHKKNTFFGS